MEALRATTNRILCEVLPRAEKEGLLNLPQNRAKHWQGTRGEVTWGRVVSVGPDVRDAKVGMVVAIDPSHRDAEVLEWNGKEMMSVPEKFWRFADSKNCGALFGIARVSD